MPARFKLDLAEPQRICLEQMRDHPPKAYAREHAAALLKIADGQAISQVAQSGLLKPRTNETVGLWVKAYQNQGLVGLFIKSGRGRKPLFSPLPQPLSQTQAYTELEALLVCSPQLHGLPRSRWWLAGLKSRVAWLAKASLAGISKLLKRLKLVYKRGRIYLHSPDLAYKSKVAMLERAKVYVKASEGRAVLLYQDEFTYYRRASVAQAWVGQGQDRPRAEQGLRSNKKRRICGCLNWLSGQLFSWQRSRFDRKNLIRYYQALAQSYPEAEVIYLVQDNWPVHTHPEVIKALAQTKLQLIFLPTYAPWTNPIEKVWRKLYGEILHLHAHKDDWEGLQGRVEAWLAQFDQPSPALLRYVGLFTD